MDSTSHTLFVHEGWLFWMKANYASETKKDHEVMQSIADAHAQSFQGSFKADREKDELTLALGNKEHPGRTGGQD